jgi:hypothetical protein
MFRITAFGLSVTAVGEQHGSDGMLRVRHALGGAAEGDARRHGERAVDPVAAGRQAADGAFLLGRIERRLDRGGVVGDAVPDCTVVLRIDVGHGC